MNGHRRATLPVKVGALTIGGGAPVSVQTMAKTDTRDVATSVAQALESFNAGAALVRFAVPDAGAALALAKIKAALGPMRPVVADIHFDHRLALSCIEGGVDALRLNPGNIGSDAAVREVAAAASDRGVPIRIGVNAGSLDRDIAARHGGATAMALAESALREIGILEKCGFSAIVVSVKASDLQRTVEAYRLVSDKSPYPLHVGLTEAGSQRRGTVHSAAAIGLLLAEGIGDTIRVSLTADPVEETKVGLEILRAFGLCENGASVTSCPGCGRTQCDLPRAVARVESALETLYRARPDLPRPKVAVMGCTVNGPGEAREADIALVGGKDGFLAFERGVPSGKIPEDGIEAWIGEAVNRAAKGDVTK